MKILMQKASWLAQLWRTFSVGYGVTLGINLLVQNEQEDWIQSPIILAIWACEYCFKTVWKCSVILHKTPIILTKYDSINNNKWYPHYLHIFPYPVNLILTFFFHLGSAAKCPGNTFTCDNGECVTKLNTQCDFISDCADGSDEAHCGTLLHYYCPFFKLGRWIVLSSFSAVIGKWK